MSMFKMGYIKVFSKEESLSVSKLCNIVENPETKLISLRDFKIMILAINKLFYEWMTLNTNAPGNGEEDKRLEREFGFFFNGKFYIKNKQEVKTINQSFSLLYETKKVFDMTNS